MALLALAAAAVGLWYWHARATSAPDKAGGALSRRALGAAPAEVSGPSAPPAAALPSIEDGKAGIEWVTIPGGSFTMSIGYGQDEERRVSVKTFQIAMTLVTNGQYKACIADGACTPPADYGADFSGDDQPVVGVKWEQAKAFAQWAGGRLPSEAEWEYAALGGGKRRKYPWGDEAATCERALTAECRLKRTQAVCSASAGNSEQGLCDMAGNAWEWVQDRQHDSRSGAPTDARAWEDGTSELRVIRGGAWNQTSVYARSAYCGAYEADLERNDLGFRPARSR